MNDNTNDAWPALPYNDFKSTSHLLHMAAQILGKIKLATTVFEPHWANVPLWLSVRGITTGPLQYNNSVFEIEINLISHQIEVSTIQGLHSKFSLENMSVASFMQQLFAQLHKLNIEIIINTKPQEVTNPIPFEEDKEIQIYHSELANAWWRILLSSFYVMQKYHARFDGETPPIGLMWGTFDIRDARYNGIKVPTTGINAGYIRRNAMDEAQIEIGWWPGNESYPQPAYYSFTYPQPPSIEKSIIQPKGARWEPSLSEFVLDYELLRKSSHPEKDLLAFFESTYDAGAKCAKWDEDLQTLNGIEPNNNLLREK